MIKVVNFRLTDSWMPRFLHNFNFVGFNDIVSHMFIVIIDPLASKSD